MATVSRGRTSERYRFIERNRQDFKVNYLCDWLKVSRSGYYDWRNRKPSRRDKENQQLIAKIKEVHRRSRGTYGSPRVHQALLQMGQRVSRRRIARLMRFSGLQGRVVQVTYRHAGLKRFNAAGTNLRLDQPEATDINQIWAGDVTYLRVKGHWCYLAVVMDVHSRRILGWSLKKNRTTALTLRAMQQALKNRKSKSSLIFHTDRGIEYTAYKYQEILKANNIKSSLNRPGYCTDNAHMESFFHSLKTELIRGRKFKTEKELRLALNSYINQFYNHKRLHSGIGYLPPVEYERMAA